MGWTQNVLGVFRTGISVLASWLLRATVNRVRGRREGTDQTSIIEVAAEFYLHSDDFNGIPVTELARRLGQDFTSVTETLNDLVRDGQVTVLGLSSGNPHILRSEVTDIDLQIAAFNDPPEHVCVYVKSDTIRKFIADDLFADQPFKRELALGAAQFSYRSFDLMVLETYRNDPRFTYSTTDISGRLCVTNEHYESENMLEADKTLLETFGFAYDDDMNRAVAVFLRYLSRLSPEHQQVWQTRLLHANFKLHPDYFDMELLGIWSTRISICDAIIAEIRIVNQICNAMKRPNLFRNNFGEYGEEKPRGFTLLIRPTHKEFYDFAGLLDRMLSDNLNHKFFQNDVSFEVETLRSDDKIVIERKGTLRALDEWLRLKYQTEDWTLWDEAYQAFRDVRKLRQVPAHGLNDDVFDQTYFGQQRDLLERVYSGLRILRLLMQNHPNVAAANIEIPDAIENGNIVSQ